MTETGRRGAISAPAPVDSLAAEPPEVSCVICTTPRSGSWLLADGLLASGTAGRPEEYFRADWYLRFRKSGGLEYQHRLHREDNWPDGTRWSDPPASLKQVPRKRRSDPSQVDHPRAGDYGSFLEAVRSIGTVNGIFAIKIHRHQLDQAVQYARREVAGIDDVTLLNSWLRRPHFVFLRRRDTLRRAVSHYRAIQSDVWWCDGSNDNRPSGNTVEPAINPEEVARLQRACARQERQWIDFFRRARVKPLLLTYEMMAHDPNGTVMAVLRHMGIDSYQLPTLPPPRLKRQADAWTDAAVHNYVTWRRARQPSSDRHYGFDVVE